MNSFLKGYFNGILDSCVIFCPLICSINLVFVPSLSIVWMPAAILGGLILANEIRKGSFDYIVNK
jgi:hypothetical protein